MASVENFWICPYENAYIKPLIKLWNITKGEENFKDNGWLSEDDINTINEIVEEIETFDYKKMNSLASKIQIMTKRKDNREARKLQKEYNLLYTIYDDLSKKQFRTSGKKNITHYIYNF